MQAEPIVDWLDLPMHELLGFEATANGIRSVPMDMNHNQRSYGGHSIAMALVAACQTAPKDRPPSLLNVLFLSGARAGLPVDYQVTPLQDGKRFCSRHVRATQDARCVLDAQATFAAPDARDQLQHSRLMPPDLPAPEDSLRLRDLPRSQEQALLGLGSYTFSEKSCFDFRLPKPEQLFAPAGSNRFEFWIKTLGYDDDSAHGKAVGLAYLSDWWLSYTALSRHVLPLQQAGQGIYVASLNHSMWFHQPHSPAEWTLFVCDSHRAHGGRGLATASIYSQAGALVATANQEVLMAARGDSQP